MACILFCCLPQVSGHKNGKQQQEAADALSSPPEPAQLQHTDFSSTSSAANAKQQGIEGQTCNSSSAIASQLVSNQLEPRPVQATAPDARVQHPPEPQTHTQKASGSSQNAFTLLMRASKGTSKAQPTGPLPSPPDLVANNLSDLGGSKGLTAAGVGSKPRAGVSGGRSGVQAGWQGALQRIAAHPERWALT